VGVLSSDNSNDMSVEERLNRQEESNTHAQQVGAGQDSDGDKAELLEQLSESDLKDGIDDPAIRNLLTTDIPTSNFDEADVQEFRGFVDAALIKKRAAYPHENQDVTGVLREYVHNDPNAGLEPINKQALHDDEAVAQAIKARILKAKNGSLVRRILSSIKHSVLRRENSNDTGGGRLLDRLK